MRHPQPPDPVVDTPRDRSLSFGRPETRPPSRFVTERPPIAVGPGPGSDSVSTRSGPLRDEVNGFPIQLAKVQRPALRDETLERPPLLDWLRAKVHGRVVLVLADAGYGLSAPFRQGLTTRKRTWAVGVSGRQKVYPANVKLIFPVAGRGRPRQRHIPDILSRPVEEMLTAARWRSVSWRQGTRGALKARFAAVRVRIADGPPQRIGDKGQQHLPGEEVWLIGERRTSGERKYYLANLPPETNLRRLAAIVKARWICEQAHQQLKEELGLDHFEGRSWQGLHRHALMTMIAYAFLQHRRLANAGRGKKNQRAAASTKPARRAARHSRPHPAPAAFAMSALQKINHRSSTPINLPK